MVKKIETLVLYLFLFLLPWQTRIIIFQTDWYFNEYKAGFLYVTDIILFLLLLFWFWKGKFKFWKREYFLLTFFAISGLSLFNSLVVKLSLYQLLKLAECILLYFYVSNYAWQRFSFKAVMAAILAGGVFQSLVAISQFVRQASLNLRFTGESILSNEFSGVALFFNTHGEKILRSYGTMPHPNVLAVYLFAVIIGFYVYYFRNSFSSGKRWIMWGIYALLLLGLWTSFSRIVIFAWLVASSAGFAIFWWQDWQRRKVLTLIVLSLVVSGTFVIWRWPDVLSRLTISNHDEAIQLRIYFNREALRTSEVSINWLGVGLGNFVPWFMLHEAGYQHSFYQPVHNLYLLIYAEIGLLGLVAFLGFLGLQAKRIWHSLKHLSPDQWWLAILWLAFLGVALFDHFFWTLQQGRLLFWLVLAIITSSFALPKNSITLDLHGKG